MDHGADRGWAFHGIRQPDVQRELRRFTDGADEEQQTDQARRRKAQKSAWNSCKCVQCLFGENLTEGQRTGGEVKIGNAQQHEYVANAGGHECFHRRVAGGGFRKPEADQQVGTQAHDLPAHEEGQQVIGDHQHVHAKGEQTEEGEEARVHRLDRRNRVFVPVLLHGRTVRRKTLVIVVALGLAIVVVAHAVEEDHQHRPCHKEQDGRRERVDQHADL